MNGNENQNNKHDMAKERGNNKFPFIKDQCENLEKYGGSENANNNKRDHVATLSHITMVTIADGTKAR